MFLGEWHGEDSDRARRRSVFNLSLQRQDVTSMVARAGVLQIRIGGRNARS